MTTESTPSAFALSRNAARRALAALALAATIATAAPAAAGSIGMVTPDRWTPHTTVGVLDNVTLRIHWLDDVDQLREAASSRAINANYLHGFSILSRNTQSGAYFCDVFVVRMRGALVDKERT